MSSRLDKDRQDKLQPIRMEHAIQRLEKMGYELGVGETFIKFYHKQAIITFYPYSGWHSGKTIEDGRGWNHLFKQLTK